MFIPELGHDLFGRMLAIWEGRSGLPLWKEDAYRALWQARAAGARPPPAPLPCAHLGRPIPGETAPDRLRAWHRCDHPGRLELAIAEVVCSCRGCGPNCPGYQAED